MGGRCWERCWQLGLAVILAVTEVREGRGGETARQAAEICGIGDCGMKRPLPCLNIVFSEIQDNQSVPGPISDESWLTVVQQNFWNTSAWLLFWNKEFSPFGHTLGRILGSFWIGNGQESVCCT